MTIKKKKKTLKNKRKKTASSGLSKFASITTNSLSKAFTNYKKNQEIKKIREIKLKKLENNQIIKENNQIKLKKKKD